MPEGRPRIPVTDRDGNVLWESYKAAARGTGFSRNNIKWHMEKHGHIDYLGIGKPMTPVTYKGRVYESVAALSRAKGFATSTIMRYLAEGKSLDGIQKGKGAAKSMRKPLKLGNYDFESLAAAARALEVKEVTLRWWLDHPHLQFKLMRAIIKYEQRMWKERQDK